MKTVLTLLLVALFAHPAIAQDGVALLQKGMQQYQQGEYETAISTLRKSTDLLQQDRSNQASAYLALGIIYQLLNDEEQAKTEFSKAIIVNPDLKLDRDFYSSKTLQLFDQAKMEGLERIKNGKQSYLDGNYEKALEQITTGVNLLLVTSPQIERHIIIDGYLTTAKIHQLMAKNELAVASFQKAIAINPELDLDPELYSSSTIELFRKARGEGETILRNAKQLIAEKNPDKAVRMLEQNWTKFVANNMVRDANYLLAQAYFLKKEQKQASTAVAAVLKIDPSYESKDAVVEASFSDFFKGERLRLSGALPTVLVVRGSENVIHDLTIQGFKEGSLTAKVQETSATKVVSDIKKFAPRIIFATGANSLQAVAKSGNNIPVVFTNVTKAEAAELTRSNVGGIYWEVPVDAQLSFLSAVLPAAKKIGIIYNKKLSQQYVDEALTAGRKYGLQIISRDAQSPAEVEIAFNDMKGIDALWMIPDKSVINSPDAFKDLLELTNKKNIPLFAYHESFVKEGALFSVSSDFESMGKQAADLVQELLLNPGVKELPLLFPGLSKLSVSLKAAKKLKLEINPNVLTTAANVYK